MSSSSFSGFATESNVHRSLWSERTGTYSVRLRYRSTYSSEYDLGSVEIYEEEWLLLTTDGNVVLPVSETQNRGIGGVFDGELMSRSTTIGEITWQDRVYVP